MNCSISRSRSLLAPSRPLPTELLPLPSFITFCPLLASIMEHFSQ